MKYNDLYKTTARKFVYDSCIIRAKSERNSVVKRS